MEKLKPKIDIYVGHGSSLKMENQGLCSECIEYMRNKYGDQYYVTPFSHCHHPEQKKPPCKWCEKLRNLKITYHGTPFWETLSYLILCRDEMIKTCPVCGEAV